MNDDEQSFNEFRSCFKMPETPALNDIHWDVENNKFLVYNGSVWVCAESYCKDRD